MPTSYTDADVDAPAKPKGQFTDSDVDTPQSTPINDSSTIGPAPQKPILSLDSSGGIARPVLDTSSIENYTTEGRTEHPILSRIGDVTRGAKELWSGGQSVGKPMGTSSGVGNSPVTAAMSAGPALADAAPSIGPKIADAAGDVGDWAASVMRKRATPIQAQFGEAGSVKPIPFVPKDFQPKIPEGIVPKGRPGTWTNPGPYNRVPLRVNPSAAGPETGLDLSNSTLSEQGSSGNGRRPSPSEREATNLVRKDILTPQEYEKEKLLLGDKAARQPGEGRIDRQGRLLGHVRSRRGGVGMPEPR